VLDRGKSFVRHLDLSIEKSVDLAEFELIIEQRSCLIEAGRLNQSAITIA